MITRTLDEFVIADHKLRNPVSSQLACSPSHFWIIVLVRYRFLSLIFSIKSVLMTSEEKGGVHPILDHMIRN